MKKNVILFSLFAFFNFWVSSAEGSFSDTTYYIYSDSIEYAQKNNIVQGYSDGTFRPFDPINRAEFTKILVESFTERNPSEFSSSCFSDVKDTDWFSGYVCFAKENGILSGYPDGTFQPGKNITIVEAAKMLANTFQLPVKNDSSLVWYVPYIDILGENGYLPSTLGGVHHEVLRGEMTEMIWRMRENIHDSDFLSAHDLYYKNCIDFAAEDIPNVDMEKVRETWISWINDAREGAGLHPYIYNEQLDRTAYTWAKSMADMNTGTHKRPGQTQYYDYYLIMDWFADLGLEFQSVHRVTYTENIGWGPFRCSDDDCTDEMIKALKYNFDAYMGEKGATYSPHYDSVMNPYYNEIGMGIALTSDGSKMFMATHYATEIISNPPPICPDVE